MGQAGVGGPGDGQERNHLSWDLLKVTGSPCNSGHRPGFLNVQSVGGNYAPHAVAPFVFQVLHSTPGRFPVFLFKARSYSAPCSQVKTRTLLPPCFSQGPWDQHGEGQLRPCTCSFLCQELDLLPFALTLFHFHWQIFSTSVQFLLGFVCSVCSVLYLEGRGNGWGKRL